jgi:dipeptidyl aminopeptidase/acylaminoacyl peptidase
VSRSIERYLNVQQAYGASFASDGRSLGFVTNITGLPQVWRVRLPEGDCGPRWPEQLTFGRDRVSEATFSPASGDGRLIYTVDVGGSEKHQMMLLDTDTGRTTHLSEGYDQAMHLFGSWDRDGDRICYAANRRHPATFDLYVQSVAPTGSLDADLIWRNDARGYLRHQSFSPRQDRVACTVTASSFDHALVEVDIAARQARPLLTAADPYRVAGAVYSATADALYVLTDLGAEYLYVARLDLETLALHRLVCPPWDCGELALSHSGRQLVYSVNEAGLDRVYLRDLASGETRSLPAASHEAGVLVNGGVTFSPDDRYLAFSMTSAVRTADVYVWDLDTDSVRPTTCSSHGGIPQSTFVAPELVNYPTFDVDETGEQRTVPAWYFAPATGDATPSPALVMVHGGPESQFRPGFNSLIQYFVQQGYAVLAPNVRGSTGYGKTYSHLDDVEKRMDSVGDLASAAEWLKARPDIEPTQLVVYGGSYGGFMVLAALTTYPDLWAAGVDIVGISNLATFLENTSDYRRAHREAEYGSLSRDRAYLERIAPINHIERLIAPLMVIHGRNDPRVPLSEAEQLVAALRGRGVPVEFLVFDDEGHGVVRLENKLVAYPAIAAFLREHVG